MATKEQEETEETNRQAYEEGKARREQGNPDIEGHERAQDLRGSNTFRALGNSEYDAENTELPDTEITLPSGAPNPKIPGYTANVREILEGSVGEVAGASTVAPVGEHTHNEDGTVTFNSREIPGAEPMNEEQSGERTPNN